MFKLLKKAFKPKKSILIDDVLEKLDLIHIESQLAAAMSGKYGEYNYKCGFDSFHDRILDYKVYLVRKKVYNND